MINDYGPCFVESGIANLQQLADDQTLKIAGILKALGINPELAQTIIDGAKKVIEAAGTGFMVKKS